MKQSKCFSTLMTAIFNEESLNEEQIQEVMVIQEALKNQGKTITLTDDEISSYIDIKAKLAKFNENLSEETKQALDEGIFTFIGGNIKDIVTLKNFRESFDFTSGKKALKVLPEVEKEMLDMVNEMWPADKKEPTRVFISAAPLSFLLLDKKFLAKVRGMIDAGETMGFEKDALNYYKGADINKAITKDRNTFITAIKTVTNNLKDLIAYYIKKTGKADSELVSALNFALNSYVLFIEMVRKQARMAA